MLLLVAVSSLVSAFTGQGQTNGIPSSPVRATNREPHIRARLVFEQAQTHFQMEPQQPEAGWEFARAAFDLAEFATNSTQRANLGEKGVAACRQLLTNNPGCAPLHYYLAMNLGQIARTKGLGALKLVDQMEREFLTARKLDAGFDYAGPDRNLGLLYRDAPALGSVGSRSHAKQHLTRAVVLAPEFPENRLNLIESYLEWKDHKDAVRELKALEEDWPAAHSRFNGDAWMATWSDWEARLEKLKKKTSPPVQTGSAPAPH